MPGGIKQETGQSCHKNKIFKNETRWINFLNRQKVKIEHHKCIATEGADAYPPLLLFKCFLLQKLFYLNSDTKLENQINDRLSFKKFLRLSFSKPSPDHSTFSRFRSRLSKEAMDQINSEILR